MSTHKDEKNGTWYVMVRYHDWKGTKRQKCKRGFATRREAQEWERNFRLQTEGDPDMTFEAFLKLYEALPHLWQEDAQRNRNPGHHRLAK